MLSFSHLAFTAALHLPVPAADVGFGVVVVAVVVVGVLVVVDWAVVVVVSVLAVAVVVAAESCARFVAKAAYDEPQSKLLESFGPGVRVRVSG